MFGYRMVVRYALVMTDHPPAHCDEHETYDPDCGHCGVARLTQEDGFEIVFPRGRAQRVPRDVCRCPILMVGDFCPVHGG